MIPISKPSLGPRERELLLEAMDSGWISGHGDFVERFERRFADLCETGSAVSCSNGTVALHLVLRALNIGAGDEVIVPDLTYVATANAVRYCGAEPVFARCDDSWCVDPCSVERMISAKTRAVIAVHLYGNPAPLSALWDLATHYGFDVIEDAAQAHLATHEGVPVGSRSRASTFSFYSNKIITCGEGGAITTPDDALAQRMRFLRGQAHAGNYWFPDVGYNYRLSNLHCAILCAQLERADELLARRRTVWERYQLPTGQQRGGGAVPWLFTFETERVSDVVKALSEHGIETRPLFPSVASFPPYRECRRDSLRPTHGLSLPTYVDLELEVVDRISSLVHGVHNL